MIQEKTSRVLYLSHSQNAWKSGCIQLKRNETAIRMLRTQTWETEPDHEVIEISITLWSGSVFDSLDFKS